MITHTHIHILYIIICVLITKINVIFSYRKNLILDLFIYRYCMISSSAMPWLKGRPLFPISARRRRNHWWWVPRSWSSREGVCSESGWGLLTSGFRRVHKMAAVTLSYQRNISPFFTLIFAFPIFVTFTTADRKTSLYAISQVWRNNRKFPGLSGRARKSPEKLRSLSVIAALSFRQRSDGTGIFSAETCTLYFKKVNSFFSFMKHMCNGSFLCICNNCNYST